MPKVVKEQVTIRFYRQPDGTFGKGPEKTFDAWKWFCKGCGFTHSFWMDGRWTFDGDEDRPTFSPSLLLKKEDGWAHQCHTFVRDGRVEYLSDCSHPLAGQTIELPELGEPA